MTEQKQPDAGRILTFAPEAGTPRCGVTDRVERADSNFRVVAPRFPLRRSTRRGQRSALSLPVNGASGWMHSGVLAPTVNAWRISVERAYSINISGFRIFTVL